MFNFNIKHYDKGKLFYKFLVSILLIFTLTPITLSASTSNVIVGPISVLGEIKKSDLVLAGFCHDLEPVDIKELKGSVLVYNKEDISSYKGKSKNVFSVSAT